MKFIQFLNEDMGKRVGATCPNCQSRETEKSTTHTGMRKCKKCNMLYDPNRKVYR